MTDEHAVTVWLAKRGIPADVLALNASRLSTGAKTYGPLSIDHDPRGRDFRKEAGEEAVDALSYVAMHALQLARSGVVDPSRYPSQALLDELAALARYAVPLDLAA